MKAGTAEISITPEVGIDLAGFAVREQPCQSILDALWLRVLYLEDGGEKLLWAHAEVLALDERLVRRFRDWVWAELGIPPAQVIIAATHTHSAPATIQLTGCGQVNQGYLEFFESRFRQAVLGAIEHLEPCSVVSAEGQCPLAINRRKSVSASADPRVGAVGFRRADGSFKAVILSYAMHPVCLKEARVSGDWPGETARFLGAALPGSPLVIVSSGACGNINPPSVGVTVEQTYRWGRQVGRSILPGLLAAQREPGSFKVTAATVDLPVEGWSERGIENYADTCRKDLAGHGEFGGQFALSIEIWRSSMIGRLKNNEPARIPIDLRVLSFPRASLVTVNAEIFSRFSELLNQEALPPVYIIGCANGMVGYVPSAEAYSEGGYEVSWSMLFYNQPRVRRGGLERIVECTRPFVDGASKLSPPPWQQSLRM